ncbi:MAG: TlpA family protein disulfide reductase [Spirochaetota bacterium]
MKQIQAFVTLLIVFFLFSCSTHKQSNFHVEKFVGVTLDGKEVVIRNLNARRVALNVYSPTCVPCFKELPALHYLYDEMQKNKAGELYIVVDPYSLQDGQETKSAATALRSAQAMMQLEKEKRGIRIPILIMKPPFAVKPEGGLVTGTPETLLFDTKPLSLFYNFIGPLSEAQEISEITQEPRVVFFKRMFAGF